MPRWLYDGLRGLEMEGFGSGGRRLASSCFLMQKNAGSKKKVHRYLVGMLHTIRIVPSMVWYGNS